MDQIADVPGGVSQPARSIDEQKRFEEKRLIGLAFCGTDEVLQTLQTRMSGLTQAEVQTRLQTFGLNEVAREKRLTPLRRLYNVVKNPLVVLLSILALISLATGDLRRAISNTGPKDKCSTVYSQTITEAADFRSSI